MNQENDKTEFHDILRLVDASNGNKKIEDIDLTGYKDKDGNSLTTLYEALGNKTIYDLILDDYPSYFTWEGNSDKPDKFENAIDINTGNFKDGTMVLQKLMMELKLRKFMMRVSDSIVDFKPLM